jgi:hypothetical protein
MAVEQLDEYRDVWTLYYAVGRMFPLWSGDVRSLVGLISRMDVQSEVCMRVASPGRSRGVLSPHIHVCIFVHTHYVSPPLVSMSPRHRRPPPSPPLTLQGHGETLPLLLPVLVGFLCRTGAIVG